MVESFGTDIETVVDQIHAELADESLTYFVYYRNDPSTWRFKRVVCWLPVTFKSTPPSRANTGNTSVLLTDFVTVECWIMSEDWQDVFEIRRRLITACHKVFGGGIVPIGGAFPTQLKKKVNLEEAFTEFGPLILQNFVFEMNVLKDEALEGVYRTNVREIDIVDRTQITTTADDVLTPSEQMEITED